MIDENQTSGVDISAVPEDEPKQPEKPVAQAKSTSGFKFKYYCSACSGRAFLSEEKSEFDNRTCQSCGASVSYEPGNYLPLNDSELRQFNG